RLCVGVVFFASLPRLLGCRSPAAGGVKRSFFFLSFFLSSFLSFFLLLLLFIFFLRRFGCFCFCKEPLWRKSQRESGNGPPLLALLLRVCDSAVQDGQSLCCFRRLQGHWEGSGPVNGPKRLPTGHRRQKSGSGDLGGDHLAFSCDVAEERDVQNTFEEMEKKLGRVNFLVNAAGINRDSLLVRTKTEDMISQLHTNLLGSMLTCKVALKTMIQQQRGSIVNVGSVIGLKGNSGQSVYSAGKGGLVGFSRALAKEVARKKIRVNVVAPDRGGNNFGERIKFIIF
uniref:3-ketoacyl-[acyl-carrier-protein] reductase beta subunit n=1 Tax=Ursus maritimus TaxID=29073 RepID=A0A452V3D0_URSMA